MRLPFQLLVEEHFVVLLPGESFSNAITLDFRLMSKCLSFPCPLCVLSIVFSALMFNIASEIAIASLGGFPP